jgi:hypothetical protein
MFTEPEALRKTSRDTGQSEGQSNSEHIMPLLHNYKTVWRLDG